MANDSFLEENIQKFGWAACGTATEGGIPFTYSVGFNEKYNAPEILVVGVDQKMAHRCIVNAAELLIKGEVPFTHGDVSFDIIQGSDGYGSNYKVKFVECSDFVKKNFMCQANFHYGRKFSALQMYWPDIDGRLPDDLKYECISQMLCERDL